MSVGLALKAETLSQKTVQVPTGSRLVFKGFRVFKLNFGRLGRPHYACNN